MPKDKNLAALARAVEIVGEKPLMKTQPPGTLARLKRAAAGTSIEQDKTAMRARRTKKR